MASLLTRPFVSRVVAMALVLTLAGGALAQQKKGKEGRGEGGGGGNNKNNQKSSQSEGARRAIGKQKDIARGLADRALAAEKNLPADPASLQKMLDDLKAQLQTERDRHAAALASLNADLKAATQAGGRQRINRARAAVERENKAHAEKVAGLEKQIAEVQAKLDAAGGSAPATQPAPAKK